MEADRGAVRGLLEQTIDKIAQYKNLSAEESLEAMIKQYEEKS